MKMQLSAVTLAAAASLALLNGCKNDQPQATVRIDGSSTVEPISTMAAEKFRETRSDISVQVGTSGTGGGFKKFLDQTPSLRTDINNASRPIKLAEMETAARLGIEFIELPIGLDGIALVVNPENKFCEHLTVAELKRVFEPGSKVNNWKDIREGFPDVPLKLYGPGRDSGTFDYFTEAIVGKEKAGRDDSIYSASENDNVLVQGVMGDRGALGYFGFAYYEAYQDKLKLLAIDRGDGKPLKPTLDGIRDGSYKPLSRPLFIYVSKASLARPEVTAFLNYYMTNAPAIVEDPHVQYVALPPAVYDLARQRLKDQVTGSAMARVKPGEPVDLAAVYGAAASPPATVPAQTAQAGS